MVEKNVVVNGGKDECVFLVVVGIGCSEGKG